MTPSLVRSQGVYYTADKVETLTPDYCKNAVMQHS